MIVRYLDLLGLGLITNYNISPSKVTSRAVACLSPLSVIHASSNSESSSLNPEPETQKALHPNPLSSER